MRHFSIFLFILALLNMSCGGSNTETKVETDDNDTLTLNLEGDSTVYGLACDGCTDTILVFLPLDNISGDPDTFNILNATRKHHILGRPKIGDNIAVVRNSKDSTIADYVINMKTLRNTWCYKIMPTLHLRADMEGKTEKQKIDNLPDSIKEMLETPREYSMQMQEDNMVTLRAVNRESFKNHEAVDYPKVKRYGRWNLYNGKLLLTEIAMDTLGNLRIADTDTCELMLLEKDSLVLKFFTTDETNGRKNSIIRSFYTKRSEN